MIVRDKLYIDGAWVASSGNGTITVTSPVTEEPLGTVPDGTAEDMDRAVAAARRAFDEGPWRRLSVDERADKLSALARVIEKRSQEIASLISSENGVPIMFSAPGEALGAVAYIDYVAEMIRTYRFTEVRTGLAGSEVEVTEVPVGVAAAIVPWNAPLLLAMLKVIPALAVGCSVVWKPAPETPLDSYLFAECVEEVGFPAGVINIVAAGREVGEHLVTHPGVDKVAFTGSTAAGRRIASLCGELLRPVTLELGGKSAAIICEDADLSTTLPTLSALSMMLNGQACVLQSRVLIPRGMYREFVEGLGNAYSQFPVGDPLDPGTLIGPLVAERQRARVESYIAVGQEAGAKVVTGGGRPKHLDRGWFVEPTLLTDVDNSMRVAREEIFGPVVCAIPYDGIDEAIAIANDSDYGLSGSVWSSDIERARQIARRVDTGMMTVNGLAYEFNAPMGGMKASGLGREMGPEGLRAYLEYKTVSLPAAPPGV
ncbi:Aldehyde Dehydrogenase [Mycolicibacterium rhodesiae JS60]|nr:Aldehyde Dehydrogenase [Mycolicibacterium rhodesiae JS60]